MLKLRSLVCVKLNDGVFARPEERLSLILFSRDYMEAIEKHSVTPISFGDFEDVELELPFPLEDIRVDSVEGLLRAEHFAVWKHLVSSVSVDRLEQAKVDLVHQFASGYAMGKDEEDSKDLLLKAFACLRVVKPMRTPLFRCAVSQNQRRGD